MLALELDELSALKQSSKSTYGARKKRQCHGTESYGEDRSMKSERKHIRIHDYWYQLKTQHKSGLELKELPKHGV